MWGPSLKRLKEISGHWWNIGSDTQTPFILTIRRPLMQELAPHPFNLKLLLPLIHMSEGSTKNHKTCSIIKIGQDKWGNKRNFIYHPISVSIDIWDNNDINKIEQKHPENLKNTLRKLKMIGEIRWGWK